MKKTILLLAASAGVFLSNGFSLTHSRAYQWGFKAGNLATNWSFENPFDSWIESPNTGITVVSRLKAAGTPAASAKSGSYVANVNITDTGAGTQNVLYTNYIAVSPSTDYTLSFYYKTNGTPSAVVAPVVLWTPALDSSPTAIVGSTMGNASNWTLAVLSFTTPSNAAYLRIVPARYGGTGSSGTFYFDDVVLEEGALSSSQAAANRLDNSEAMAFGDALGRVHQSQVKATAQGDWYTVTGSGFDNFARPETTFLATPYHISTPTLQTSLLTGAQGYYNNSDSVFDAHGYPFSRVRYFPELSPRINEAGKPDAPWALGAHTTFSNYYFVTDTAVPSNIESPSQISTFCKYRLDWVRGPDSTYALTWTNKLGQVVRSASNITRSGSNATNWKWAGTGYKYHPAGNVQKTLPPSDDSAGGSSANYAEVAEADSRGLPISANGPDRKLQKSWYNRLGQVRYTQTETQRADYEFIYFEYDNRGRLISQGTQTIPGISDPPQDSLDVDTYNAGTKVEEIGYIYDDTTSFQARTGFTLQSIMGYWKVDMDMRYSDNRLVCKYNKNPDDTLRGFTAKDKFVADFFTYDDLGRVTTTWKYIGPERDSSLRLQDCWYGYDEQGRMTSYRNYVAADSGTMSNAEAYHYDFQGRIDSIADWATGKPLTHYKYLNWGPLREVILGGTASHDSAAYLTFNYHSQGGLDSITATGKYGATKKAIFQQFLGYEAKALNASGVPSLIKAKYDGSITQQVYKYTHGLDPLKPVRAVNYDYDQLGRMSTAKAYVNSNSPSLGSNEEILTGTLAMAANDTLSTSMQYDLNGRIRWQLSAGASAADTAKYTYQLNSYKLDKVTGKLSAASTRNMSASGTFAYDSNGAMVADKSKKLRMDYGWDGLPLSFTIDSLPAAAAKVRCCTYDADGMPLFFKVKYPSLSQYNFYDADGNRVSRVEAESKPTLRLRSTHYVYIGPGMAKEWHEEYNLVGRIKKSYAIPSLFGQTAQIGRIRPDGKYEFYLKNHLGSTMRTVDDRGRYDSAYSTGRDYDYLAYGPYKLLKAGADTNDVTQKFTGKEFEALTGLYAFGARWYDPELGVWLGPDPAGADYNPYSYVSSNPINFIDPNGLYPCPSPTYPNGWCDAYDYNGKVTVQWHPGRDPEDASVKDDGTLGPPPDPTPGGFSFSCDNCGELFSKVGELFSGGGGGPRASAINNGGRGATGSQQNNVAEVQGLGHQNELQNREAGGGQGPGDAAQKYLSAFPGVNLGGYDANNLLGSAGEDFGQISNNPVFQFSRDLGVPTGEVVATLPTLFVPGGIEAEAAGGVVRGVEDMTYLYQKVGPLGEHLKYGITKNPGTRYTLEQLNKGRLRILAQGAKKDMLALERALHENLPIGPEERQLFYILKQVMKGLRPPPYWP